MNQEKYIQDIKEIREMMDRSGRFISLSGISGVVVGVIALLAAFFLDSYIIGNSEQLSISVQEISSTSLQEVLILAISTILIALLSVFFFTARASRKSGQKLWNKHSQLLLINLAIPLFAGGLVCLILMLDDLLAYVIPLTLVFYGLALVNASKYTLSEIRNLGIGHIVLGLGGLYFINYGLVFWAIGFGILHIIYGIRMHLKYGS